MFGCSQIPREQIFNRFMVFMYKKQASPRNEDNEREENMFEKIVKKVKPDPVVIEKNEKLPLKIQDSKTSQKIKIDEKGIFRQNYTLFLSRKCLQTN